jgi:hypothetical protein
MQQFGLPELPRAQVASIRWAVPGLTQGAPCHHVNQSEASGVVGLQAQQAASGGSHSNPCECNARLLFHMFT